MKKVLVADDEVLELEYLANLFENLEGFELIGKADNADQAVAMDSRYDPDVVILDINMPGGGLEAAQKIRAASPDKIIIINTAYAQFDYAKRAVDMHLDGYLIKPSSSEDIIDTVKNCISRKESSEETGGSPRAYHAELYRLMETMITHVGEADPALIAGDRREFMDYMDKGRIWDSDCSLFLINSLFRMEKQLRKIGFPESVLGMIDFEGCVRDLDSGDPSVKRKAIDDLLKRIGFGMESGVRSIDPVALVRAYIEAHYAEELTLSQLAGLVHFSTGHLSRLFNSVTGMTLRTYINRVRIEQVEKELTGTDKPVAEIAMDCGFRNVSHFYRIFKEQTGTTPRDVRRSSSESGGQES